VSTSTEETALVGGNAAGEISVAAEPLRFLDLGTGSGNIAVSVLQRLSGVEALAVDASPEALEVARRNARRHGVEGRVQFLAGDLFDALPGDAAPFHAIASNPPYIPPRDHEGLSREVRDFEPRLALVDERGGAEGAGLGFHRAIVLGAGRFLVPGGLLALEVGAGQAQQVVGLFAAAGFTSVDTVTDYGGIPRVVKGLRA
jgi:release factor glutamine methyltransferase